jgi:hypothetical protein
MKYLPAREGEMTRRKKIVDDDLPAEIPLSGDGLVVKKRRPRLKQSGRQMR